MNGNRLAALVVIVIAVLVAVVVISIVQGNLHVTNVQSDNDVLEGQLSQFGHCKVEGILSRPGKRVRVILRCDAYNIDVLESFEKEYVWAKR